MLAELPVCNPRLSLLVCFERQGVDEYGLAMPKLDVVSGGILETHTEFERRLLNLQRG
jgi:hypothetical protein